MKQLFALVDCNTFYASCEKIFRPDLKHKPVLVLSNNDGCIISRDHIAKSLDIPELVPFFQVEARVKQLGCQVFSSNYELYGDISARVMSLLEPYATAMEVYSIDEAFLQVQAEDYQAHGQAIKAMLWQNARMPVCVGIPPKHWPNWLIELQRRFRDSVAFVCWIRQQNGNGCWRVCRQKTYGGWAVVSASD